MFSFGGDVALKKQTEKVRVRSDYDYLFKLVLIGDHSCGKSCLLVRFADNHYFNESYISTIGVEFKVKTMEVNGRNVKVQCWDTTGQERFRSITSSYYRGAHGLLVIYDVTKRETFNHVSNWVSEIERYANSDSPSLIIGTKCDLVDRREVTTEEGKALADSLGMHFIETSARTGENVDEAFTLIVRNIMNKQCSSAPEAPPRASPATTVLASSSSSSEFSLASISSKISSFFSSVVNPTPAPTTTAPARHVSFEDDNDSGDESFDDADLDDTLDAIATEKKDSKEKGNKHKHQKTDVNVVKLDLAKLTAEGQVMTGDPSFCTKCAVVLNNQSKVKKMNTEDLKAQNAALFTSKQPVAYCGVRDLFFAPEGYVPSDVSSTTTTTTTTTTSSASSSSRDTQNYDNLPSEVTVWTCEFCDFHNLVGEMNDEELPQSSAMDYVISPATAVSEADAESQNIVFCIDISGSMCVTTEVVDYKDTLKGILKTANTTSETVARTHAAGAGDQKLPSERRGIKYVSRLQCVQAAIEQHISHVKKSHPNHKIGLISFNDEVTIIGDGTQEPLVVAGDKLESFQSLKEIGEAYSINKSVQEAEKDLVSKLWALQENGCTALGPALFLAILVAGAKPASKVILCTDGLANHGIGSMDGDSALEFTPFYTELAEIAYLKGVTVSIISIAAEDCSLENLSVVTDKTRGEVERVDPRKLANNFQSLLTNPIVATGCMATIFLHKGLMFRNEIDDEFETDENLLRKDLGNVTADTECTFSYAFRPKTQIDLTDVNEVPFQVQLVYTKLNGMKCLRVETASIKLTEDRKVAEKAANIEVIGTYAAQRAAKYAKDGDFERAQMETRAANRFMQRNETEEQKVAMWKTNVGFMDNALRNERKKEKTTNAKDKASRKKGLKENDDIAVVLTKTKNVNANSLFM